MSDPEVSKEKGGARILWTWVIAAFVVLIAAWILLIVIATTHQPELIEIKTP